MLKITVGKKIMQDAFGSIEETSGTGCGKDWRILVVDHLSLRIMSSCCKMHEIASQGRITLIEDLQQKRESLPTLEAIYLITPSEKSVRGLMNDFVSPASAKYKCAHVFFTETCADQLFSEICQHPVSMFIKTLKEINIAFLPYESQVFLLDNPDASRYYLNRKLMSQDRFIEELERTAEQIATLCVTLGEYPVIRYRVDYERNAELARLVQQKLDAYKANEPTMGEAPEKMRSRLIILDRGFDCISPILHELTLQAMAYDLLPIENDIYKYVSIGRDDRSIEKEVTLDENDEFWVELRHQHIAVVSTIVSNKMKKFTESKRLPSAAGKQASMKDVALMAKKMPEYHKELSNYGTHSHLADSCMKSYNGNVDKLFKVEQELLLGTDVEGQKIKDPMRNIVPILLDTKVSKFDKIRIILLFVLSMNGISEGNLTKLIQHAQIPLNEQEIITNMALLGANVIAQGIPNKTHQVTRRERVREKTKYQISHWTPILKDIAEDTIEGKLDQRHFPFLTGRPLSLAYKNAAPSARYRHWKDKNQPNERNVPRVIIFVMGGVSFSEIRSAYEVTNAVKSWEVIVGSTHLLTPEGFLNDLKELSE